MSFLPIGNAVAGTSTGCCGKFVPCWCKCRLATSSCSDCAMHTVRWLCHNRSAEHVAAVPLTAVMHRRPNRPGRYRYFWGRKPGMGHLLDPGLQDGCLQQFEMRHMRRVISHHLAAGNLDSIRCSWPEHCLITGWNAHARQMKTADAGWQ